MSDLPLLKKDLRAAAMVRRLASDPAAGAALAEHVLREVRFPPGCAISGIWPLEGEIDLRPLLHALHARGHAILLPETTPRGHRLIFRAWSPGAAMVRERFGTWRPEGDIGIPDLLFVPLLAFDRAGNRLGYGGGYYDRTLAALPGRIAIGFGYAAQEVDWLPAEAHDQKLHAVATERGIITFGHPLKQAAEKGQGRCPWTKLGPEAPDPQNF